ncbi:thiamine-phosphate kinase [Bacillus sp. Marseille-P3661]|uniref:thiamine-phosphate kinase n=1 Tax=Bacillus sp. Marseille-P3661 TaxID=1936234 RepID=UPI000C85C971|nr:thiamine-phosphate kinase [Bacillus sp. Marseille-P3661]
MSIQDEFSFIKSITPKKINHPFLVKGIGDDAALFSSDVDVEEVVCMDTMIEEVHFTKKTMKPYHIGYKVLASNISDIAAMGGQPTFYLVSIAIPKHWSEQEIAKIYAGMTDLAERYKMDLIGGDTVSSMHSLTITITVLGRIKKGCHLLRNNAKVDDLVFVTGNVGESAAGLELLLKHGHGYMFTKEEMHLVARHQMPEPRVEIGQILASFPRVALNDVSDGIASESNEIAEASNVSIVIDADQLPRSEELCFIHKDPLPLMLNGGEDYELIGTIPKENWDELKKECQNANQKITQIGIVKEGPANVFLKQKNTLTLLQKQGYNHFKK